MNAIDEVTQFEIIISVERISERYLIPVLEEPLKRFPFCIKGFAPNISTIVWLSF